jgi:hypothetical protein
MHLEHIHILFFSAAALFVATPLAAQTQTEPRDVNALFLVAPPSMPADLFGAQTPTANSSAAAPAPPESPVEGYRRVIREFRNQKHQFVHCKLRTGKILTGQIKAAGFEAFDIKTEAIMGIHQVKYDDLAESPRAVPAVGTRIKQSAEWTGVGVGVVVLVPLFILLSPFLFLSGVRC